MVYHIKQNEGDLESAFDNANKLVENRVLKHYEDNLLLTDYSIIYIPIYSLFIIICYSFMVHSFHKAENIIVIGLYLCRPRYR